MANQLTFLTGANADYISHLYTRYLQSPQSVDSSWQQFFAGLNDDEVSLLREMGGASWTPADNRRIAGGFDMNVSVPASSGSVAATGDVQQAVMDTVRALQLIRAYRARGHLICALDPLQLMQREFHPELDPTFYGFTSSDFNRPIYIKGELGFETATLNQIVDALRKTYSGTMGVEFLHMTDPEEKDWVQERFENIRKETLPAAEKRNTLQRLTAAEGFEKFLHVKFTGTKRFGCCKFFL